MAVNGRNRHWGAARRGRRVLIQEPARNFAPPIAPGTPAAGEGRVGAGAAFGQDAGSHAHDVDLAFAHKASSAALPPDLAALERAGLAPGPLHAALGEAKRVGVEPFDALLSSGAFDEETLVAALARALGVDVAGPGDAVEPIDADTYGLACQTGHLAALDATGAPRFVIAARGSAIRRLAVSRRGRPRTHAIALAGPRAFADIATARAGVRLARRAAEGPGAVSPGLTVAGGMPRVGPRGRAAILALALAIAGASILTPGVGAGLLALGGLVFAVSNGFRLLLAFTMPRDRIRRARLTDADLPVYTVMTALYREAAVIPALLDALERFDYPRAKLDLKILVEQGDAETLDALRGRPPRAGVEVLVLPPGGPRTKPRALNAGLLAARGEFVTVYDAEDRPDPAQLRLAVEAFRRAGPDLACVQAKLAVDNLGDGWLVRHFAIEYAALFYVVLPALAALRLPIPLGGTSNHFRAETLRALGGWDAGNVTEDADLGLRLAGAGLRTETIDSVTWEEAPISAWAWIKQRTRWMKGYMVTAIVHGRRPGALIGRLGVMGFAAAQLSIAGVAASALAYPVVVGAILLTGLTGVMLAPATGALDAALAGFHVANLIVGFACGLACGWMGIDRRCPERLAADLLTLPFYWLLVGAAAWRALHQIVMDETTHWEKTAHGVSSRRATPPQA